MHVKIVMPHKAKIYLSSTVLMLHKLAKLPVNTFTRTKDTVRTISKPKPSKKGRRFYEHHISELLKHMGVQSKLKNVILANVRNARTLDELSRTYNILKVLDKHKLRNKTANQFFLGGHFKIADGGALFNELSQLPGAAKRFSSHCAKTKIEEKGISAGRILPEVLFLISIKNGITYSHFQAEASPWRQVPGGGWKNWVPGLQTLQNSEHIYDSIIYFAAKQVSQWKKNTIYNRSNYGWSPYADNNPITSMSTLPEEVDELPNKLSPRP